jgi:hypothetical protein
MDHKYLSPRTQQPVTGPIPQPGESSSRLHILFTNQTTTVRSESRCALIKGVGSQLNKKNIVGKNWIKQLHTLPVLHFNRCLKQLNTVEQQHTATATSKLTTKFTYRSLSAQRISERTVSSSLLRLDHVSGLLPSAFPTKAPCTYFSSQLVYGATNADVCRALGLVSSCSSKSIKTANVGEKTCIGNPPGLCFADRAA